MRGARAKKYGSATMQGKHRLAQLLVGIASALLAAVACVSSRAHAADGGSGLTRRVVLSPEALDRVTAGSLSIRIDADAAAHGNLAFAAALVALQTTYGQALMVHVDPLPQPRPPHLMGTQELAMTSGSGQASASGDQNADCSVTGTVMMVPDVVASMVSSDKVVTATTAFCQCSLLVVSLAH